MPREKIRALLSELHQELEAGTDIDAATKDSLRGALDEIQTAIGADDVGPPVIDEVQTQLGESAVEFQAEHPRVARLLSEVADTLGKLGI
jgi:hypothetical protein